MQFLLERAFIIAGIFLIGYGFAVARFAGSLTALVATCGVGTGLAIATTQRGTGLSRNAKRVGGVIAAVGCLMGVYHGGWSYGWIWGIGGYLLGIAAAFLTALIKR